MRDSRESRSINSLPPRGTMRSTYSVSVISSPTAARSAVSTSCTAASGGRALYALGDLPDGVGEPRHLLDAFGHLLDELRGQRQPVDERGVGAVCLSDVGAVGCKNFRRTGPEVLRHEGESAILRLGVGAGQRARGSARGAAQLADVLPNIKLLIHGPILAQAS